MDNWTETVTAPTAAEKSPKKKQMANKKNTERKQTMKKIYQNPTIYVVNIKTQSLMQDVSGFEKTLNSNGGDGSSALSRQRGRFFDDDEE